MGRSVVAKGKNVAEAIELALQLLGTERSLVDIEILEVEKRGFLGLGNKPAAVKVQIASGAPVPPESTTLEQTVLAMLDEQPAEPQEDVVQPVTGQHSPKTGGRDGMVWVESGIVHWQDALNHYPTITPEKGLLLYRNGERVTGTTILMQQDEIRIDLEEELVETEWEIKVTPDKMKAVMAIRPGYRIRRRLQDQEPDSHLVLRLEESRETLHPLSQNLVYERLDELGIVQGINHQMIQLACQSTDASDFIVAEGTAPEPGEHGRLQFLLPLDVPVPDKLYERDDGTVDYRERVRIPTVKRGEVVADVLPPIPGKAGLTVTGETIFPDPVYPLVIKEGKGIIPIEDGTKLVAIESGRPEVRQSGQLVQLSIMPKIFHPDDVDLSSGHIRFNGDVEITGHVQEGMEVTAEGEIVLHQNVNMAKVVSGSSLHILGNVISSEIVAGKKNLLLAEMSRLLGDMTSQMRQLIAAIEQLYRTPAFKTSDIQKMGLGALIKILMESKYKGLADLIRQFCEKTKAGGNMFDQEWHQVARQLQHGFLLVHPEALKSLEELQQLQRKLKGFLQVCQAPPEPNSVVRIRYAVNSSIYCSGNIYVTGQGCYNTRIYAGGELHVSGFIRGGTVYASLGAVIGETGTKAGNPVSVWVGEGRTISIQVAKADTVIQIGRRRHKFLQDRYHVFAQLDPSGDLHIQGE